MPEIKPVHTACKKCIFAEWEKNTQTGCFFNRTSKFDDVLEVYDDDSEFFVINGRKCNYFKEGETNEPLQDLALKLINKHKVRVTLFVYVVDLNQLAKIIHQINAQNHQFEKVYFVDYNKTGYELNALLRIFSISCDWQIIYPLEGFNLDEIPPFILNKANGLFTVWKTGNVDMPPNWVSFIDKKINEEVKQICLIKGNNNCHSGFTTMKIMMVNSGIYSFSHLEKFLDDEAAKDNKQHTILNMEDVY